MSTHNYKVLKNYPVQYIVKNPRHWWQTINTTYSEDTTIDVELRPFEGLEFTVNRPLITFSRQTLLDGIILEERTYALEESGQEYAYADGVTDINVVGTLTEDNGVYSGFSTANYLLIEKRYNTASNMEIVVKFTTGSDVSSSTTQNILHAEYITAISVSSSKFSYYNFGSRQSVKPSTTVQPNTTYWIKCVINGTQATYEISTNGVDFDDSVVMTDNLLNPLDPAYSIGVGISSYDYRYPFGGSIDLKETYIKTEGKFAWDYNNTKYYYGCLEGEAKIYAYNYTALVKDGEVLLVDYDQLRTGYTWANTVTIPGDDYFAPVEPFG